MAVHSEDRHTWSTKLERIGKLTSSHPELVFNNIGHVIDVEMLREMYHKLNGNKAIGFDKVTKAKYGEALEENLKSLLSRIRKGHYVPRGMRITEIPKEDGSKRPLAISCFEDKLVQLAVSTILERIFEPSFLGSSYGYRPHRSAHDALRALNHYCYKYRDGAVVEIDIQKYFNSIPHQELKTCLRKRISDRRFLRLIERLIKTPILEGGVEKPSKIGCPQGSIISPNLSNIYLHYEVLPIVWTTFHQKRDIPSLINKLRDLLL